MPRNVQLHKAAAIRRTRAGRAGRASGAHGGDISRKRFTSGNAIGHVRHCLMFKQLPVIAVCSQRNVWFRFALLIQKDARRTKPVYFPYLFVMHSAALGENHCHAVKAIKFFQIRRPYQRFHHIESQLCERKWHFIRSIPVHTFLSSSAKLRFTRRRNNVIL